MDSKGGVAIGSSCIPTGPEGSNGKLQVHGHIDGLGGTQMGKRFVEEVRVGRSRRDRGENGVGAVRKHYMSV